MKYRKLFKQYIEEYIDSKKQRKDSFYLSLYDNNKVEPHILWVELHRFFEWMEHRDETP